MVDRKISMSLAARGGILTPVESGTYPVDERMVDY